jgi:hypothetical protein
MPWPRVSWLESRNLGRERLLRDFHGEFMHSAQGLPGGTGTIRRRGGRTMRIVANSRGVPTTLGSKPGAMVQALGSRGDHRVLVLDVARPEVVEVRSGRQRLEATKLLEQSSERI